MNKPTNKKSPQGQAEGGGQKNGEAASFSIAYYRLKPIESASQTGVFQNDLEAQAEQLEMLSRFYKLQAEAAKILSYLNTTYDPANYGGDL